MVNLALAAQSRSPGKTNNILHIDVSVFFVAFQPRYTFLCERGNKSPRVALLNTRVDSSIAIDKS